jgi:hypothetical protein
MTTLFIIESPGKVENVQARLRPDASSGTFHCVVFADRGRAFVQVVPPRIADAGVNPLDSGLRLSEQAE